MTEMVEERVPASLSQANRSRIMLTGGLAGALLGLAVAYVLLQRLEEQGGELHVSAGEGVRLGISALAILRQVADLAHPDEQG